MGRNRHCSSSSSSSIFVYFDVARRNINKGELHNTHKNKNTHIKCQILTLSNIYIQTNYKQIFLYNMRIIKALPLSIRVLGISSLLCMWGA